jgi:hypothetical protein
VRDGVVGQIPVVYRQRLDDRRLSSATIARCDSERAAETRGVGGGSMEQLLVLIPGRIVVHFEPERLDRGVMHRARIFASQRELVRLELDVDGRVWLRLRAHRGLRSWSTRRTYVAGRRVAPTCSTARHTVVYAQQLVRIAPGRRVPLYSAALYELVLDLASTARHTVPSRGSYASHGAQDEYYCSTARL